MHKLLFYFMISLISAEIGEGKEGIYIFMLFHPGCQPSSSLSFPSIPPPFNCWVSTPFTEYRVLVLNGTAIPGKAHGNLNILTSLHVTVPNCVFLFYIIVIGFVKPHTQKKIQCKEKKSKFCLQIECFHRLLEAKFRTFALESKPALIKFVDLWRIFLRL